MKIEIVNKAVLPAPVSAGDLEVSCIYATNDTSYLYSLKSDCDDVIGTFFIPLVIEHGEPDDGGNITKKLVRGLYIISSGTVHDRSICTGVIEADDKSTSYYLCEHMKITLTF